MNWNNASFVRKVAYVLAIAALLLPIAYLSQPATLGRQGTADGSSGGKLAQLRSEYRLAQAELGEIDPASETMKLASLGLRGVAVDILWYKANEAKKKEDFTSLELTVKQLIRLQPNFLKVWDFQAHNLTYNSSVEFDNYRDRYAWVKKGIDFLILGTHYNRDEPGLLYQLGWFTGQKMGRADESRQFRRMFRTDTDFHDEFRKHGVEVDEARGMSGLPDSWLVAKLWYDKAEEAAKVKPIRLKTPLVFYQGSPMSCINGASAIEKEDGIFGQTARMNWLKAHDAWKRYGNMQLPTSVGFSVRLTALEELKKQGEAIDKQIDELLPGVREELRKAKVSTLDKRSRETFEKPAEKRSAEENIYLPYIEMQLRPTPDEMAAEAPADKRIKVRDLADELMRLGRELEMTAKYRGTVNFDYWTTRCEAEQTDEALLARELIHNADALNKEKTNLTEARKMYEQAWDHWAVVYDKHPLLFDSVEASELVDSISHYLEVLSQSDTKFPADFKLQKILEINEEGRKLKQQIDILQQREVGPPVGARPAEPDPSKQQPGKNENKPSETKADEAKEPAKAEIKESPQTDAKEKGAESDKGKDKDKLA